MIPASRATRARRRSDAIAFVLACLVLAALALWNNVQKSAWTDEAFSFVTSAHRPLDETIQRAIRFELQPPLYFTLLNLWLRISPRIEVGRFLSTACALGTLAVLWVTARRLRLRRPMLVVWMAALTPGLVWASTEMRGYALVLFLVATANLFFVTLVLTDPPHPRRTAVLYGVTALACLLTFYYSGFVLVGHWLACMVARRRRGLFTLTLVAVGALFAPLLPTVRAQVASHPNPLAESGVHITFSHGLHAAMITFAQSILGETTLLDRAHAGLFALAVLCIPAVAWLVGRRFPPPAASVPSGAPARQQAVPPAVVLAISTLLPILLVGTLRATGATLVYPRHMLMTLPGVLLSLAVLIDGVPWPRVSMAIAGIVTAMLVLCLADYEVAGIQVTDWRSAALYVLAHATPTEPVLVAPSYEALPFEYYYPWPGEIVPIPQPARFDTAEDGGTIIRDSSVLGKHIDLAVHRRPFWMVESERPTVGSFGRDILERLLTQHYRTVVDTSVFNVSIRRMVPR